MYLITGCSGFIGFNTTLKLLKKKNKVVGVDNMKNYYDVLTKFPPIDRKTEDKLMLLAKAGDTKAYDKDYSTDFN